MHDNTTFANKLFSLNGFQRKYTPVILESVSSQFPSLTLGYENQEHDWNYLLTCASAFALSEDNVLVDAAFRIAQFSLSSPRTTEDQKAGAAVVMDRLTNFPSLKLAIERGYLPSNYSENLPPMMQLEKIHRGIQYSLIGKDVKSLIPVNRFQSEVYEHSQQYDWVSISAPTSSGKSFILLEILVDFFSKSGQKIVVYIVPTRSLIQQVENDIAQIVSEHNIPDIFVTSVPMIPKVDTVLSFIFVLTQERYQWILNEEPHLAPHMLIIDEAQKIGDGARGVLLQQVIDETVRRSENTKVIFSSPMTSNPEVLLEQAPTGATKSPIVSEHVTVNQNLIWVSQAPRVPTRWNMDLCFGDSTHTLGSFTIAHRPTSVYKRLALVVHALGNREGGNLVYMNGPADAEKTATLLFELQGLNANPDQEILDLIDLVKHSIHPNYALNRTLLGGVAFHYGNMPLLVKNEIERLFKTGKIQYLVCTSTLIEGVNLPAKSIFVRKPKKGNLSPMGEIDFWNLAGRAGRQGKEFQGNVICIDPSMWIIAPPTEKVKFPIEPTLDDIIINKSSTLIDYIEKKTPRSLTKESNDLEHAFVYYFSDYLRYGTLEGIELLQKNGADFPGMMSTLFQEIEQEIEIPRQIIFKNAGISPIAQQNLLNYFKNREGAPEELIPALPESEDALDNYIRVIDRISKFLSGESEKLNYYHALLVINWMRGKNLAYIIARNWKYWKDRGKNLPTVIRNTMKDIEEFARFKFVKYSSCYNDILKYHFSEIKREDLIEEIPNMNIWLEFGASQATQISFMSLGLSRTSAIILSDLIFADDLNPDACLHWLNNYDFLAVDVSPIILSEVNHVLERHGIRILKLE